jgi:hypothetical protein
MNKFIMAGCLCLIAGVLYAYVYTTKIRISRENEILELHGNLQSYQFVDGVKESHYYTFYLANYNNIFQIDAEIINDFDVYGFKALKNGAALAVGIAKSQKNQLNNSSETISVFSLKSADQVYLDEKKVIITINDNSPYWIIGLLIVAGSGLLFWGVKVKFQAGRHVSAMWKNHVNCPPSALQKQFRPPIHHLK